MMRWGIVGRACAHLVVLLAACLVTGAVAQGGPGVLNTPTPGWVRPAPLAEAAPGRAEQASNGVYYLVRDSQVRIQASSFVDYFRLAIKVTAPSGLAEAGRLSFTFNPTNETFAVHGVRVWRDGVASARQVRFTVARREQDLENGIVDGALTAYGEVDDVRVGDIVDYDVSWTNRSRLWPGGYAASLPVQWSVPLAYWRYRILHPKTVQLTVTPHGEVGAGTAADDGAVTEHVWEGRDPSPVIWEDNAPERYRQYAELSVSTMGSWSDVAAWARGVYAIDTTLSGADQARVAQLLAGKTSINDRITALVRFVQTEIRYAGDEVDLGAFAPRTPSEVLRHGFGDCKDKSLLLATLLRGIGVDAAPALTHLTQGADLPERAPSPHAFDHVIVELVQDGETYWIDPTDAHQGGVFPTIAAPLVGYALPVREAIDRLAPVTLRDVDRGQIDVREDYDLAGAQGEGIRMTVRTEWRGRSADAFRAERASKSAEELAKQYLDYYLKRHAGMAATDTLTVVDDPSANTIVAIEKYLLPASRLKEKNQFAQFPFYANNVADALPALQDEARRTPVEIPYPALRRHTIRFVNAATTLTPPAPVGVKRPYLEFAYSGETYDGGMELTYTLETKAPEIGANDAKVYKSDLEAIDAVADLQVNLSGTATDPSAEKYAGAIGVAVMLVVNLLGALWSFRVDRTYSGAPATFYPVSVRKFVVMSVFTFGAYATLWAWKNWRWVKAQGESISPFWRAFFSIFTFGLLAEAIRARDPEGKPSRGLSSLLAWTLIVWAIGARIAERVMHDNVAAMLAGVAVFLWFTPLVVRVNAINGPDSEARRFNSRFRPSTIAMAVFGALVWLAFIAAEVAGV